MTIGTATVASTKVRSRGGSVFSQSPSARLSTERVGKTASQIISASWCLLGGAIGADAGIGERSDTGAPGIERGVRIGAVVSDHGAGGEGVDGGPDVLIDEVGV